MDLSRPLSIWPLHLSTNEAAPTHTFEKSCNRVQDCAVAEIKAGSRFESGPISGRNSSSAQIRLAAMCVDKTVSVFDYARHEKLKTINIGHALTCVSLSNDGQEMLVNLNCNEIWSMGVEDGEVRQKYQGQKQGAFVIRSCYGGATEGFVVSGGEGLVFPPMSLDGYFANSIWQMERSAFGIGTREDCSSSWMVIIQLVSTL